MIEVPWNGGHVDGHIQPVSDTEEEDDTDVDTVDALTTDAGSDGD